MNRQTGPEWAFPAGLGACMLGATLAVVGLMALSKGGEPLLGMASLVGGLISGVVGALLVHQARRSASPVDPHAGLGRRDRDQRQRRSALFMAGIQFLFALILGLPALGRMASGQERPADVGFALFVMLMAWVALAQVQGWDGGSRKARKYLEDEWTRVLRASAMTWGYVTLLAGVSVVYAISLWRPEWTPVALALALAVGGAVPALRFAFMDKAADPENE